MSMCKFLKILCLVWQAVQNMTTQLMTFRVVLPEIFLRPFLKLHTLAAVLMWVLPLSLI